MPPQSQLEDSMIRSGPSALEGTRKRNELRSHPFPPFASMFKSPNGQKWVVQHIARDEVRDLYNVFMREINSDRPVQYHIKTREIEDAQHFGTNLALLLETWPFGKLGKMTLLRRALTQLAVEMTSSSAVLHLPRVSLKGGSYVSWIDYFSNEPSTSLTPRRLSFSVSPDDIPQDLDVPDVPSYVRFGVVRKHRVFTHEAGPKIHAAARLMQHLCWDRCGSIANPLEMRQAMGKSLARFGIHRTPFGFQPAKKTSSASLCITHPKKTRKVTNIKDEDESSLSHTTWINHQERVSKRRKTSVEGDEEDDDTFVADVDHMAHEDDFIVEEDDLDPSGSLLSKRRRSLLEQFTLQDEPVVQPLELDDTMEKRMEISSTSAAQKWAYHPYDGSKMEQRPSTITPNGAGKPEWLVNISDMDQNPPDHPDYNPSTLYIPKPVMDRFGPYHKQYWGFKQQNWDTIVFFQRGNGYQVYEKDAKIALKISHLTFTDRDYMCAVFIPLKDLHPQINNFVARGYKVAVFEEVREGDGPGPTRGVQRRLTRIFTGGTLTDSSMLHDDMSIRCAAIKESEQDGQPAFGVAFVDTASGQFFLTDFVDDRGLTKFETFIAQIRPRELLLEKSCISKQALKILKNSSAPTTVWNYLKPGKEFWTADTTHKELNAGEYFIDKNGDDSEAWPTALLEAKEKELVMSAFGALLQHLRMLRIERALMTLKNVSWYDPIKNTGSLILDGKTLDNLEVLTNPLECGPDGTLFSVLNHCKTAFGKRMLHQWVCHPLIDAVKINSRLGALESLNADPTIRDLLISDLAKLPDLERMISRIHAGDCKIQDFVRVISGFEQIVCTMSLLKDAGLGQGLVEQLISQMPNLTDSLRYWSSAFDHTEAKAGLLIPGRGQEKGFDENQDQIDRIRADLNKLLLQTRKRLHSPAIKYQNPGQLNYRFEVPVRTEGIPKEWDQDSKTQKVERYYSPEVKTLTYRYQEIHERQQRIVKELSSHFFKTFDEDYTNWLEAIEVVAHLDCLISLARASSALGEPVCRPVFVDEPRNVIEFENLRYPCLLSNVLDFIPNDIKLGGDTANISLLTGANASGKSTIFRMSCLTVIMAQIGCLVPASSARLTPIDRILSRIGAVDNIFAAESTFFVELAATKKILSEATSRSLVIIDELGRGTSSHCGVAIAQAVLHHLATRIGCIGFFSTHYHSLTAEFSSHPEIRNRRMRILVNDENKRVIFLYKLEDGVAERSFGMNCASMCGIPSKVVERAEVVAREREPRSKLRESREAAQKGCGIPLGTQSDLAWLLKDKGAGTTARGMCIMRRTIERL